MRVNLNKIRGLMAERGETQKDLAKKLGVSVATVNNYLNGRTQMTVEDIGKISLAYEIDAFELLQKGE